MYIFIPVLVFLRLDDKYTIFHQEEASAKFFPLNISNIECALM